MIVLDSNVVSELMRAAPDPEVVVWLRLQPQSMLVVTTVTVAEVLYGVRRLPLGRRRSDLERRFQELMAHGFRDRLLSFDEAAADAYSNIMTNRRRIGRPIEILDAMIAGIALSRGAEVATRNVPHFLECGLRVVDPWAASERE
ncbi:MAG: type II toxin-antitoxin system VapC family toxin [Propylenella sp.]